MADIGHSRLLKFFTNPKMADSINESNGITSAVPGEQRIREDEPGAVATKEDFTLSPVITVTKKEASFAKGDLKLQQVTVTEDISDTATIAEDSNLESIDSTQSEESISSDARDINSETGEEVKKVSKIPRLRFRAAVNKIRSEQKNEDNIKRKEMSTAANRRRSSIPRLKGNKTPPPKEETEKKRESINFDDLISNVTEDDFDKIYEEIVENPNVRDESESIIENKDPAVVETKFDELIHAYDSNKIQPLKIDKTKSKIPLLKRKSEHDIEIDKTVRKELQRKSSLGRIPISNSFACKTKLSQTSQSNNIDNSLPKENTKATQSEHIPNNNLESDIHPKVTAQIPLSENKYTKISSIVLNKQPIRINSAETTKPQHTHEHTEDKINDAEFILSKLETISATEAEIIEQKPSSPHLEDSIEVKEIVKLENEINITHKEGTDTKIEDAAIEDDNINKINKSGKHEDTVEKTPAGIRADYNNDSNSISNETNKVESKSLEAEVIHDIEPEINNNTKNVSKDYSIKDYNLINPPIVNESEVVIKYKPEVREVEVEKEHYLINTGTDTGTENRKFNSNVSLTSKPAKYKTITASQTVEDTNEEDIIILKGKVHRVISRLDSVEPKQKKKPVDDLPKQSVKSKISLFESNDPTPVYIKNVPTKSKFVHPKDDKPKVIEGILKYSNKVDYFKELNKRKISANLENNIPTDRVKIAYGLKDELARWEKNNTKDMLHTLNADKHVSNELASESHKNNDEEIDKKVNNIPTDRVKIAYGLKDELARWEKNNTKDMLHTLNADKHVSNELASENHENNDEEIDKKVIPAVEDDVFAKKSADIINSYKLSQLKKNINVDSEMKRAKSLAELDLGDAVNGKVKKMIYRMKSVDKIEHRKEIINSRERPRKGSVSERIALFEGRVIPKGEPLKMSLHEIVSSAPARDSGDHSARLAELAAAAAKYGTFPNMSYVEVGGVDVPALWVGTAMIESGVTKELIKAAIDLGYRAFDTAYIYGTERDVGDAIREKIADGTVKREDLFVAGKLWSTFHRTDLVEQACRESLDKLGLDYFDLYMIHNPMSFKEGGDPIPMIANVVQYSEHDYLDAWYGIEDAVKKGLVRMAGVSNFNTKQIQRILDKGKIRPVVNQVESHPYLTQLGLESFCSEHNIRLSVFGTLGSKGTPAPYKSDLAPAIDDPLVITMAAGLGITPAQLLISYQVSQGRAVVVKCSSGARLWENLQALATPLRPDHVRALHNLNRNQRTFTFKGMGATHKNYPFTELI
ncbi:uncharacterized protein LOC121725436 [Aricia agestis]|uniref:uncharacterized protein LOC121725436 n=1 Tax=Aricia agestis TaxID=91739 RepID=UPI001C2086BE|nr:uncharacterized protein LOC121725436 [Aricia agestis]